MVLISAESPAGDTSQGEVQTLEAVRIVMSPATFVEVTGLFVRTLKEMELSHVSAAIPSPKTETAVNNNVAKKH